MYGDSVAAFKVRSGLLTLCLLGISMMMDSFFNPTYMPFFFMTLTCLHIFRQPYLVISILLITGIADVLWHPFFGVTALYSVLMIYVYEKLQSIFMKTENFLILWILCGVMVFGYGFFFHGVGILFNVTYPIFTLDFLKIFIALMTYPLLFHGIMRIKPKNPHAAR